MDFPEQKINNIRNRRSNLAQSIESPVLSFKRNVYSHSNSESFSNREKLSENIRKNFINKIESPSIESPILSKKNSHSRNQNIQYLSPKYNNEEQGNKREIYGQTYNSPRINIRDDETFIKKYIDECIKNSIPQNQSNESQKSQKSVQNEKTAKKKKPNYDKMTSEEISEKRILFEDLFKKLITSYPNWEIEEPLYYEDPLDQMHDRYEKIVKRIVIYQTSQKWKIYLAIGIIAIEYFFYKKWKWQVMRDFSKIQLKNIYKFDHYLVELAGKMYSDDNDDWPFLLRAGGTLASNIIVFILVNWASGSVGLTNNEFVHKIADQIVSDGDTTAILRENEDGISSVPEPPSGFTSPDFILNMISQYGPTFLGTNPPSTEVPKAEPVPPEAEKKSKRPTVYF